MVHNRLTLFMNRTFCFIKVFLSGIVCPIDHPLCRARLPLPWDVLKSWRFITNGLCGQITDERFQKILSDSHLMVRNTTSLLALVREGVGLTVVPRLVVANAEQGIHFITVNDPDARRSIEILRRADMGLSPAAQRFEEVTREITHGNFGNWRSKAEVWS